jgi:hypothetical protein
MKSLWTCPSICNLKNAVHIWNFLPQVPFLCKEDGTQEHKTLAVFVFALAGHGEGTNSEFDVWMRIFQSKMKKLKCLGA